MYTEKEQQVINKLTALMRTEKVKNSEACLVIPAAADLLQEFGFNRPTGLYFAAVAFLKIFPNNLEADIIKMACEKDDLSQVK